MKNRDDIDDATRRDYIRAVKCLAEKPAQTDKKLAPGAVNRLDDFTYIHINQTNIIHGSVCFLLKIAFSWLGTNNSPGLPSPLASYVPLAVRGSHAQ